MNRHLLTFALLCLASACLASDWPRWRGPENTGSVPAGVAVPKTLPAAPKVVWQLKIGFGHASPVVSRGKVFYVDNQDGKETVHAVAGATGKELWHASLDAAYQDLQGPAGPRCTPTVDADRIYVQSCRGEFQCLRVADGGLVWRTNFVKDYGAAVPGESGDHAGAARHGYTASPLVDGPNVLVCVGGPNGASVVCFDKRTGKVVWKSQNDVPGNASPVLAAIGGARQYVVFTSEGVVGLDPASGKLLWRAPIKTRFGRHAVTPVVIGDTVVVSSFTAGLIGVRVARQGNAWAAEKAWTSNQLAVNFASPVAFAGKVCGLARGNTFFMADPQSGQPAWAKERFFGEAVSGEFLSLLVMGSNLLVLTDTGRLCLVAADAKDCRVLGQATVCGANWDSPAYADGRLYLRDAQELKCLQLVP